MRYNIDLEYYHPELFKAQTRYCGKGEAWKMTVEKGDNRGNKTATFKDMPSDDCFGQIEIKLDP